jgi:hypothetical protein
MSQQFVVTITVLNAIVSIFYLIYMVVHVVIEVNQHNTKFTFMLFKQIKFTVMLRE